jgi:hypothetical protein
VASSAVIQQEQAPEFYDDQCSIFGETAKEHFFTKELYLGLLPYDKNSNPY